MEEAEMDRLETLFERSYDSSATFYRKAAGGHEAVVFYLPGRGWGFAIYRGVVAVGGAFDVEWSAYCAMRAALDSEWFSGAHTGRS